MVVLAVDPGRQKCGIAVVQGIPLVRLFMAVVPTKQVAREAARLCHAHSVTKIVIGDSTGGSALLREIAAFLTPEFSIVLVPEKNTTQQARSLYWQENPPKGWRRIIPTTLQTPLRPWDDYAALLLAYAAFESS